jgi:hypothetical protein
MCSGSHENHRTRIALVDQHEIPNGFTNKLLQGTLQAAGFKSARTEAPMRQLAAQHFPA